MIIYNFIYLGPYIFISLLPILILILPIKRTNIHSMLDAFIVGIVVDLLADGVIGLNTIALIPIGAIRRILISAIFGQDVINREDNLSIRKQGLLKLSLVITLLQLTFITIYVIGDSSGTRPLNFILIRIICSTITSSILSLPIIYTLNMNDKQ